MFEDQPKNQVPSNLPTIGVPPTPPAPEPPRMNQSKEPEDILGEVDQVEPQFTSPATAAPALAAAMPKREKSVAKEPILAQRRKVVLGLVVIVIIGVLAGAGWYAFTLVQGSGVAVAPDTAQQSATNTTPINTAQSPVNDTPAAPSEPVVRDTDRDGLNDDEETLYGTNSTKVDTDADGLTDRDEVRVFETDPNNPDTDGDAFLDGEEVRNQFNPKGPGPLLQTN